MIARTIFIKGHVQGAFFREWTCEQAREIGVSGWVRNLRDGRVEVYAVGSEAELNRFIDRLHEGSPASRIDALRVGTATVTKIRGFVRKQTV